MTLAAALASLINTCGDIQLPPPVYDHAPVISYIDRRVPYFSVSRQCNAPAGVRYDACVLWRQPGALRPIRVIPSDGAPAYTIECLIRHENGHLNGWPADHPNARYE